MDNYHADCKDEDYYLIITKAILTWKEDCSGLETLVRQRAWAPSLLHPHVIKSSLPLTSHMW